MEKLCDHLNRQLREKQLFFLQIILEQLDIHIQNWPWIHTEYFTQKLNKNKS